MGQNQGRTSLEFTVEAVIYTLISHQPVYYREFPGNKHDARTIQIILADLQEAGLRNVKLITDRGYDSLPNLEEYIIRDQKMIICVKAGSGFALEAIKSFGSFAFVLEGFEFDYEKKLYYFQKEISYTAQLADGTAKKADRLKLNLYFDAVRRSIELKKIDSV